MRSRGCRLFCEFWKASVKERWCAGARTAFHDTRERKSYIRRSEVACTWSTPSELDYIRLLFLYYCEPKSMYHNCTTYVWPFKSWRSQWEQINRPKLCEKTKKKARASSPCFPQIFDFSIRAGLNYREGRISMAAYFVVAVTYPGVELIV